MDIAKLAMTDRVVVMQTAIPEQASTPTCKDRTYIRCNGQNYICDGIETIRASRTPINVRGIAVNSSTTAARLAGIQLVTEDKG
jgi:hypothetical protein